VPVAVGGSPTTPIERRAFPRYDAPATWSVRYFLEKLPERGWRDGRVIDISRGGVALEIASTEVLDGIVMLEFYAFGATPRNISLNGEIRHVRLLPSGDVRVGLEFVGVSPYEVQLLDLLLRLVDVE
jgi:hypothetical protein